MIPRGFVILCVVFWSASGQQCANPHSSSFSITHRRNQTGHWIIQVTTNDKGGAETDPDWNLKVEHSTSRCNNTQEVQLIATVTGSSRKPDPNYELFPGLGYYRFHENTITWPAARETCAREGAHLLILNSDEEFAAVEKLWDKHPNIAPDWRNIFIHVGLTDHVQEREFVTLFGEHVNTTGYAKWLANEPDSGTGANCAGVNRGGTLQDSNCGNKLAFVCEKPL